MEHALLDGNPLSLSDIPDDAAVGKLVDLAKNELSGGESILLEVICDGRSVASEQLESTLAEPISKFDRIEFVSGNPRAVVVETLNATRRSIGDTFALVREAAEDLNSGNVATGMQRLVDCVEIWSQAHEVMINSGQLLNLNLDDLVVADKRVLEWLREPAAKLREIRDAIESRDHVLLGDILRYEMDEFLEGWEKILDAYAEHVAGSGVAA